MEALDDLSIVIFSIKLKLNASCLYGLKIVTYKWLESFPSSQYSFLYLISSASYFLLPKIFQRSPVAKVNRDGFTVIEYV